jgi:hypothetical protein
LNHFCRSAAEPCVHGVRGDPPLRLLLDPVVADRGCGVEPIGDVAS